MTFRRKFLFPLFAGLILILEIGVLFYITKQEDLKEGVFRDLGRAIDVSISTLNADDLGRLQGGAADLQSAHYAYARHGFMRLESIFREDGIRGLYAMRVVASSTIFLVDSAAVNDSWHSEPGVIYERPPTEVEQASIGLGRRLVGPYADEYGSFYSIFDSIRDSSGTVVAVIGADVEATAYNAALNKQLLPFILLLLLASVVYSGALYILLKRQEMLQILQKEETAFAVKNAQLFQEKKMSDEHSRRLAVLIEQLPVGVFITDPKKGKPTIANKKAIDILGRSVNLKKGVEKYAEIYSLTTEEGVPYPTEEFPLAMTLATGKLNVKSDIFVHRPDGFLTALRVISAPIVAADNSLTAVAVIFEDITAEREIDRRKTEFISIASHQLRTPLNAVKWFLELFEDPKNGRLNKEHREYLKEIKEAVGCLIDLVNQLLNASRLEAGFVGVASVQTDMNAFVRSVLKEVEPLCMEKHQICSWPRLALPPLKIDPRLVREALLNLLSNAIKYTAEKGKVALTTEVRKSDILVSVSDSGIGIPLTQQKEIFKKFFRADNASSSGAEGTGLGLYIAKQAIEMSGGTIGFSSTEGKGSVFWFTLPLSGSVEKKGAKPLEENGQSLR